MVDALAAGAAATFTENALALAMLALGLADPLADLFTVDFCVADFAPDLAALAATLAAAGLAGEVTADF